jgi:hypothetical protein
VNLKLDHDLKRLVNQGIYSLYRVEESEAAYILVVPRVRCASCQNHDGVVYELDAEGKALQKKPYETLPTYKITEVIRFPDVSCEVPGLGVK